MGDCRTLTITGTPIKCSIWEDGLVISLERDPTGDSFLTFIEDGGMYSLLSNTTTSGIDGSWNSIVIDTITPPIIPNTTPYLVYSTPITVPYSILQTTTINGTILVAEDMVAPTGPGVSNNFASSAVISDMLFYNSVKNGISFQDRFPGTAVTSNDLWFDDPVFITQSTEGVFNFYANFCPRDN